MKVNVYKNILLQINLNLMKAAKIFTDNQTFLYQIKANRFHAKNATTINPNLSGTLT